METKQIKIDDLIPAEYNPRKMPDDEMKKLIRSIQEFGFVEPVVVNQHPGRENIIIGGHQRVLAAKTLGYEEVPVVYVSLPPEKEKLLNLALNRISGSWEEEKLAALLSELEEADVDLFLSGFNSAEIDELLKNFHETKEEDFNAVEELEKITVPESRPGEIYELGRHRLLCGDSTEIINLKKLMGEKMVDLVFTDPPFNVGYKSSGKNRDKWSEAYGDDDYTDEGFDEFCIKVFGNFKKFLKDGGAYYVCSGWSSWASFWQALKKNNLKPKGCIIWDKGHGGMGWSDYWYQHELIAAGMKFEATGDTESEVYEMVVYGFDEKAKHYFSKKGGARMTDVWRIPRDPNNKYEHPTQKPLKLIENAIYNSSKIGEKVLDIFGGSGSTLIACERTGRTAFLIERSPLFCDVIRKRYEKFTGGRAVKITPAG